VAVEIVGDRQAEQVEDRRRDVLDRERAEVAGSDLRAVEGRAPSCRARLHRAVGTATSSIGTGWPSGARIALAASAT